MCAMKRKKRNIFEIFSFIYTPVIDWKNKISYRLVNEYIAPSIKKGSDVLEVECGNGHIASALSKRADSWVATGKSFKEMRTARRRCKNSDVEFIEASATDLPFEKEMFDIVIIANKLHLVSEPEKILEEITRVLKKDGIIIAPNYIYENNVRRLRTFILEMMGFKAFHKWGSAAYTKFMENNGFELCEKAVIDGGVYPQCVLICNKNDR